MFIVLTCLFWVWLYLPVLQVTPILIIFYVFDQKVWITFSVFLQVLGEIQSNVWQTLLEAKLLNQNLLAGASSHPPSSEITMILVDILMYSLDVCII